MSTSLFILVAFFTFAGVGWYFEKRDVAIFWDYENCQVPKSLEAKEVVKRLVAAAMRYGTVKHLRAYLVPSPTAEGTYTALEMALKPFKGVLERCFVRRKGEKDVADKRMLADMLMHAFDIHDRAKKTTIVLVTGDGGFIHAVKQLRKRGFEVVVIAPFGRHDTDLEEATSSLLDYYNDVLNIPAPVPAPEPAPEPSEEDSDSSSQATVDEVHPEETTNTQQEDNEDMESHSGLQYDTEDLKAFEPLITCLVGYTNQGYATPYRALVGESLANVFKIDPEVYQRAGCQNFRSYIKRAEDLDLIECGRSGNTDWIQPDPELMDQLNIVARIGAASKVL